MVESKYADSSFEYAGFIFYAANTDQYLTANSVNAIRLLADMGSNTIDFNWNIFQSTPSSNILNDYSWEGSTSGLGAAIDYAHSLGLSVTLKPTDGILDGSGAGVFVQPADVAAWFASYQQEIVKYATLAQQHHVELFTIGTEFIHLDRQPEYLPYWTNLISAVRQVYSGQITYAAAVPNVSFADPNYAPWLPDKITFWNQLDYVGLDLYPTLTGTAPTSVTQVANGWLSDAFGNNWITYINSLAAQAGRPVMLTELGFPSYSTGYELPPAPVPVGAIADPVQQALLYDGTYLALTSWLPNLAGITQWVEAAYPPEVNAAPDMNSPTGFGVFGKPAQFVLSSWWGAKNYLAPSDTAFTGSFANDRISLFGDQINSALQLANGGPVTAPQTFSTTIAVTFNGNIINNHVPTLRILTNGTDYGPLVLSNTPNGYIDPAGVAWTTDQTFTVTVPGLVQINQLKIAFDSPVNLGGPEASAAFISAVTINGTNLSQATYFPATGNSVSEILDGHNPDGTGIQYDGGYTLIGASPWNNQLAARTIGITSNPIHVEGNGGTDIVYVLGHLADYSIAGLGTNVVTFSEHAGLNQNSVLSNVEFVTFQDGETVQLGPVVDGAIHGGPGNDTFLSFGTNLPLVGGGGHDTLLFDGASAQFGINLAPGGSLVLTDTVSARDGSHSISGIEHLQFSDKSIFVENVDGANIARLYSAALDRAPDFGGLAGWGDIYANNISPTAKAAGVYFALAQTGDGYGTSIAGGFTQSVEFQSKYGSLSDTGFITQLYQNVLNRAPEQAGLDGWLGLLHGGGFTRDMVLVGFAESPENIAKTAADWLIQI